MNLAQNTTTDAMLPFYLEMVGKGRNVYGSPLAVRSGVFSLEESQGSAQA